MGVRGRLPWQVSATDELFDDFMIRPLGLEAGQVIEYLPLPEEYLSKQLAGKSVLLVGENDTTVEMARAASSAGALVQVVGSTAEISTIKLILESLATLDMLFISAGPTSVAGTLETDAAAWESACLTRTARAPLLLCCPCIAAAAAKPAAPHCHGGACPALRP